eukprot:TRINITY_DN18602_c0_g1_i1.p1 TRINITY_DN18602_c0_g1~~TRINITY_DN18602_c0_g1_i1.p1  ORF type:complete len:231 (+),score=48.51 TRINITY_DN18602_c0_g1_i1:62-694(+)
MAPLRTLLLLRARCFRACRGLLAVVAAAVVVFAENAIAGSAADAVGGASERRYYGIAVQADGSFTRRGSDGSFSRLDFAAAGDGDGDGVPGGEEEVLTVRRGDAAIAAGDAAGVGLQSAESSDDRWNSVALRVVGLGSLLGVARFLARLPRAASANAGPQLSDAADGDSGVATRAAAGTSANSAGAPAAETQVPLACAAVAVSLAAGGAG